MPAVPSRLAPDGTGRSPTTITCKRQGIRPDLARCRQGVDALRFRHREAVRQSFGWPVPKLALTNLRRRTLQSHYARFDVAEFQRQRRPNLFSRSDGPLLMVAPCSP